MNIDYAPLVRLFLRYVAAGLIGHDTANILAGDPDIVSILAALVCVAVEAVYITAKKRGWAT